MKSAGVGKHFLKGTGGEFYSSGAPCFSVHSFRHVENKARPAFGRFKVSLAKTPLSPVCNRTLGNKGLSRICQDDGHSAARNVTLHG